MANRSIIALILATLILPMLSAPAYAQEEWQTHYAVNGFVNSGPPDPYQIFKIHYRVINGTMEQFSMPFVGDVHYMQANVTSDNSGILEIRFPKNYPNANVDGGSEIILFVGQQEVLSEHYNVDECFYEYSVPFTGNIVIDAIWADFLTGEPFRGVEVPESCIPETLVQDIVKTKDGVITPYHQMKAGVKLDEVVCELVMHPNGKTYCATPSSAEILKQRWDVR